MAHFKGLAGSGGTVAGHPPLCKNDTVAISQVRGLVLHRLRVLAHVAAASVGQAFPIVYVRSVCACDPVTDHPTYSIPGWRSSRGR